MFAYVQTCSTWKVVENVPGVGTKRVNRIRCRLLPDYFAYQSYPSSKSESQNR